jgi:hypothetical protein
LTQKRASSSGSSGRDSGFEDAFLDLSPSSIDALAAEVKSTPALHEVTVSEDVYKDLQRPARSSDIARRARSTSSSYSDKGGFRSRAEKSSYTGKRDYKPRVVMSYSRENGRQSGSTLDRARMSLSGRGTEHSGRLSKTTFRRTKVENTGFALHFSAPRAPQQLPTTTATVESRANMRAVFEDTDVDVPGLTTSESISNIKAPNITVSGTKSSNFKAMESPDSESSFSDFESSNQKVPEPVASEAIAPEAKEKSAKDPVEDEWAPPPREPWQTQKAALKEKYPEGWKPMKRLSPDALAGIRALHAQMPEIYTTAALAASFQTSPEAIRRILKSNWSPNSDEETDRQRRWFNRGKSIYEAAAELGYKPSKKWREAGVGAEKPDWIRKKDEWRERVKLLEGSTRPGPPALVTVARRRAAALSPLEDDELL